MKPAPDRLVLTTFKVNVHAQGRTQNCRWLDEIHYDSAAWLNPATAEVRGIRNGDRVSSRSDIGEAVVSAYVTHAVAPGVVAVATHVGHTEYGRFASAKRAPGGVDGVKLDHARWWKTTGANINAVIPKAVDPVSGQQRWMDTVVTLEQIPT